MKTGLTIIMTMFFMGIAMDIAVPAAVLIGVVVLDHAAFHLGRIVLPKERVV